MINVKTIKWERNAASLVNCLWLWESATGSCYGKKTLCCGARCLIYACTDKIFYNCCNTFAKLSTWRCHFRVVLFAVFPALCPVTWLAKCIVFCHWFWQRCMHCVKRIGFILACITFFASLHCVIRVLICTRVLRKPLCCVACNRLETSLSKPVTRTVTDVVFNNKLTTNVHTLLVHQSQTD